MVIDVLEEYTKKFKERLLLEPKWPTKSVANSFVVLLKKEGTGAYRIPRTVQTSLNNLTHSIAKKYMPDLAQVKGIGEDGLVFEKAKLFPIHTLEWILSTLEIAIQYQNELAWIEKVMIARTKKAMTQRYGINFSESIMEICKSNRKDKFLDWNTTMAEIISHMYDIKSLEGVYVLDEIVTNKAKKSWGSRDLVETQEMLESIFAMNHLSRTTRIGMSLFSIAAKINAKAKEASLSI